MKKRRSKESISRSVRRSVAIAGPGVDSEQLLGDIISEWGGTGNLAKDIKTAFDAAPEGSMIKQRFLEMVQRLIITNTMHDMTQTSEPSEMTDEELDEVATHYIGKIADGPEDDDAVAEGETKGQTDDAGQCAADVEATLEPLDQGDEWDFGD